MPHFSDPKAFLKSLFDAAVSAADPMVRLSGFLTPPPKGRLVVIGAGKASARMAEAVEAHYGACEGLVIVPYGYERPLKGLKLVEAGHPIPDKNGVKACKEIFEILANLTTDDLVIFLGSGGGSALLTAPRQGLTLSEKQDINNQLLAVGAPIGEINIVRKHLSCVKGGQLARHCQPARLLSFLISDVPGDDPRFIASGPTVGDDSTSNQAINILRAYKILTPKLHDFLSKGSTVVAPSDPCFLRADTHIIAAPGQSLSAAANISRERGCHVEILGDAIEGEARALGAEHARYAMKLYERAKATQIPQVLISGGECTVTRRGNGVGGPNAEYALSAAIELNCHPNIHAIACDTDGVDGGVAVAGAYIGPDTLKRAAKKSIEPAKTLSQNDAHSFFASLGDQIITGPTHTNVNDFRAFFINNAP